MTWLAIVFALLLEQFRPIPRGNPFYGGFAAMAQWVERNFNAGQYRHGVAAWVVAVTIPSLLTLLLWAGLHAINPLMGWAFSVVVLYVTMGFRQFSASFTGLSEALKEGDLDTARKLLAGWTGQPASELDAEEISRVAIEQGLIDAYRYVFGPLFWFIVFAPLLGPIGAVAYRAATLLQSQWGERDRRRGDVFGTFAERAATVIDWLPIRASAVSFALVGDFEDAIFCWRQQAERWASEAYGILLAAGAGAIGVRLGMPLHQEHTVKFRPELGVGEDADAGMLASAVGLAWRTLLFWMALILLISLATVI